MLETLKLFVGATVLAVALFACAETGEKVDVRWVNDAQNALITYEDGKGNRRVFNIECRNHERILPFGYHWEDDCDLKIFIRGVEREWDNPNDIDVDDSRYDPSPLKVNDDGSIGMATGVMIGALIGSGMKKTATKKPAIKKPVAERTVANRTVVKRTAVKRKRS